MYLKLSEMKPAVADALRRAGHTRPDIEVVVTETIDSCGGSKGARVSLTAIRLADGFSKTQTGSWGGPNAYETRAADYVRDMALPAGYAVYRGYEGGNLSGWGRLLMSPADVQTMALPGDSGLTDDDKLALYAMRGLKPAYRGEWVRRATGGRVTYGSDDPTYAALASAGLVKVSKNGAMRITTEGKNAVADFNPRALGVYA